jgi:flagellar biosynthesis/type III secretory pathway protein FliH
MCVFSAAAAVLFLAAPFVRCALERTTTIFAKPTLHPPTTATTRATERANSVMVPHHQSARKRKEGRKEGKKEGKKEGWMEGRTNG